MSDSIARGGVPASRTFPVPMALVDDLLPALKDTEMRILLVVLRQTLGRPAPGGGYKSADWLSHSQLKSRTGRAGEAVSAAVDALVRRGLLVVRDERGRLLSTAAERRRAGRRECRLLFAVGNALQRTLLEVTATAPRPSVSSGVTLPAGKPKTTEYRKGNSSRLRFSASTECTDESADKHRTERIESAKRLIRQRLAGLIAHAQPERMESPQRRAL